jgi:mRNA-degrading endonuclease RelE of RelBE toxin-antitoxin system
MSKINYRFDVRFLPEAISFLEQLSEKTRDKVLYTIWKSPALLDPELHHAQNLRLKYLHNENYKLRRING